MQERPYDNVHPFDQEDDPALLSGEIIPQTTPAPPVMEISNLDQPRPFSSTLSFQVVKISTVALLAGTSSLTWPIFIILMQALSSKEPHSLEQKILAPLIPYMFIFGARLWLIWNEVGHRLDGHPDETMPTPNATFAQAPAHVTLALFANSTSFMLAFLAGYAGLSHASAPVAIGAGIILGTLSYATDTYTVVPSAFRRHVENKQKHGQAVMPFFRQNNVNFLNKHSLLFGKILREMMPVVRGIVWAIITTFGASSLLTPYVAPDKIANFTIPLGVLIYWSAAYSTRFELMQLKDNLAAAGKPFEIENTLSQSPYYGLRVIGKASNGQMLIDILEKLQLSTKTSVNITLSFAAVGAMAILQQALHVYVSTDDIQAMKTDQQGLLLNYCLGSEKAAQIAPNMEFVIDGVCVTLGTASIFAKSALLHRYARERTSRAQPQQVDVEIVQGNQFN